MHYGLIKSLFFALIFGVCISCADNFAVAEGRPEPWQMWFQEAASPVMEEIVNFHYLILTIEVLIVVFVLGLMGYIILRFNAKSNPTPTKTTHNTLLEVAWTAVPLMIVVIIALPSIKLLYFADRVVESEMTLKVIGNQWYWTYQYPDHNDVGFDSYMTEIEDLTEGQPRLLTVDNPVFLPAKTNIRLLFTSADVIHNWAVPSLGLKLDAIPGRINESWVHINSEGDYYGMCSELCGVRHGFMPIHIKAVSKKQFALWVEELNKDDVSNLGASSNNGVQTASRKFESFSLITHESQAK